MAKQSIDTEQVAATITRLRNISRNISSAFSNMERTAKNGITINWKSSTGDAALIKMLELFKNNQARETVLQNYIILLEQQVRPGYENAEETNKSLASQFK